MFCSILEDETKEYIASSAKGHGWVLGKIALFTDFFFLVKRLAVIYFHIPNWRALVVPSKSGFSSLSLPVTSLSVSIKLLTWIMQMRFCYVQLPSLFISTTAENSSRPLAYTVWFQDFLGQDLSTSELDLCHNHLTNRPDFHKSRLSSRVAALSIHHCFSVLTFPSHFSSQQLDKGRKRHLCLKNAFI